MLMKVTDLPIGQSIYCQVCDIFILQTNAQLHSNLIMQLASSESKLYKHH